MPEGTALLLAQVPSFDVLGETELEAVAAVAVARSFPAGEAIFREGDASNTCYVVRSGHARAIRQHPDGRQIVLATLERAGVISQGRGRLTVHDPQALRNYVY